MFYICGHSQGLASSICRLGASIASLVLGLHLGIESHLDSLNHQVQPVLEVAQYFLGLFEGEVVFWKIYLCFALVRARFHLDSGDDLIQSPGNIQENFFVALEFLEVFVSLLVQLSLKLIYFLPEVRNHLSQSLRRCLTDLALVSTDLDSQQLQSVHESAPLSLQLLNQLILQLRKELQLPVRLFLEKLLRVGQELLLLGLLLSEESVHLGILGLEGLGLLGLEIDKGTEGSRIFEKFFLILLLSLF